MITVIVWMVLACTKGVPVEAASTASAEVTEPVWFEVEPGKSMCVSAVPEAEPLPKQEKQAFEQALGAIAAMDPGAMALLAPLPSHPGVQHARAVLALLTGDATAGPTLVALADQYPQNACLAATAALAAASMHDVETAARQLKSAREQAPNDPQIAFLSWYIGLEEPAAVMPVLEAGLAEHPDRAGLALAVGLDRLDRGDPTGVALVERAVAAGMEEGIGVLLFAYQLDHRRVEYLKLASKIGLLGDEGEVAASADPEATFAEELGVADGGTLTATFRTSLGAFECTLRPDVAPVAVSNFVRLARGTRLWTDPRDGTQRDTPLYDGTVFHRVVPDFMIQGGDPLGTGKGDPGYRFLDEVDESLRFDVPGRLALANSGPNTNGSQFFVTEAPAAHLDGRHTIFGECGPEAVAVVSKIARVPRDSDDRPLTPVTLERVEIVAKPAGSR